MHQLSRGTDWWYRMRRVRVGRGDRTDFVQAGAAGISLVGCYNAETELQAEAGCTLAGTASPCLAAKKGRSSDGFCPFCPTFQQLSTTLYSGAGWNMLRRETVHFASTHRPKHIVKVKDLVTMPDGHVPRATVPFGHGPYVDFGHPGKEGWEVGI